MNNINDMKRLLALKKKKINEKGIIIKKFMIIPACFTLSRKLEHVSNCFCRPSINI